MAMVDSAETNKADGQVRLVLGEYKYRRSLYFSHHQAESDRPLLVACGNAAHWLIEDQAEVTYEATQPCLVELRKQVQELQRKYQSPGR
jgi:hypothetical protein